jgi:hypothetical protein
VSIEGDWSHGIPGQGLVLTGLGWLTKETTLPGIPLTRIMPVEKIVESFDCAKVKQVLLKGSVKEKIQEQGEVSCVFCGNFADLLISVCQPCFDKFPNASTSLNTLSGTMLEKDLDILVEKVASKLAEKETAAVERLKVEVAKVKAELAETEDKLKTTQEALIESTSKLSEANQTIEDSKTQLTNRSSLLKDPPKMMPISEVIEIFVSLLPAPIDGLGDCIIIPAAEFDLTWKTALPRQGYACHNSTLDGHPVILIPLKGANRCIGRWKGRRSLREAST